MSNKSMLANKQNRMSLERRLSLKYSSTATKNNNRMSMPMRRESIGALSTITSKNQQRQPRQSLVSIKSQVLARPVKKEVIMSNLVNKLQYEDDLKTIIESKIKKIGNKNDTSFYNEDADYLAEKLQSCEEQIDSFKDLVRHLTQKIARLEENSTSKTPIKIDFQKDKKKVREFGVQTDNKQHEKKVVNYMTENTLPDMQFFDNLDRTLKVLSHKKNI